MMMRIVGCSCQAVKVGLTRLEQVWIFLDDGTVASDGDDVFVVVIGRDVGEESGESVKSCGEIGCGAVGDELACLLDEVKVAGRVLVAEDGLGLLMAGSTVSIGVSCMS